MSKKADRDMPADVPDEEFEVWVDEDNQEPRRRGWFGRGKVRAQAAWRKYVDTNIPAEDDADEGLPVFLRGHRGRLVFAVATMLMVFGWTLAIAPIVF